MKYSRYRLGHRLIDGGLATLLGATPAILTYDALPPAHNEIRFPDGRAEITPFREFGEFFNPHGAENDSVGAVFASRGDFLSVSSTSGATFSGLRAPSGFSFGDVNQR
jgi:hypothetical protein